MAVSKININSDLWPNCVVIYNTTEHQNHNHHQELFLKTLKTKIINN